MITPLGASTVLRLLRSCTDPVALVQATSAAQAYGAAVMDTVYFIQAGVPTGYLVNASSAFSITCVPTAANDKRAGAIRITGTGIFPFSTVGATSDTSSSCGSYDVVFVWQATCNGLARASGCGPTVYNSAYTTSTSLATSLGPLYLYCADSPYFS